MTGVSSINSFKCFLLLVLFLVTACSPQPKSSLVSDGGSAGPVAEFSWKRSMIMAFSHCDFIDSLAVREQLGLLQVLAHHSDVETYVSSDCRDVLVRALGETENVRVVETPLSSPWVRDFGPIWLRAPTGELRIADLKPQRYSRESDEFPARVAEQYALALDAFDLRLDGGNLQSDGRGRCFTAYTPGYSDSAEEISPELKRLGCQEIIFLEVVPYERTRHLDIFFQIVSQDTVVIADYDAQLSPKQHDAMARNQRILRDLGYQLILVPNVTIGTTWYTYANALLGNSIVFMPSYGIPQDFVARAAYESKGFLVREVPMAATIQSRGSIHCLTSGVPGW